MQVGQREPRGARVRAAGPDRAPGRAHQAQGQLELAVAVLLQPVGEVAAAGAGRVGDAPRDGRVEARHVKHEVAQLRHLLRRLGEPVQEVRLALAGEGVAEAPGLDAQAQIEVAHDGRDGRAVVEGAHE
jgi:hypothetical protein